MTRDVAPLSAGITTLDASVLIAWLDDRDVHHEQAVAALSRTVDDVYVLSRLTLAESLITPARHRMVEAARTAISGLEPQEVGLDAEAPERLAALRARTGLKLPDCCVLHAAHAQRAERIATFDERLEQAARAEGFVVLSA